jgi:hypothetical protein
MPITRIFWNGTSNQDIHVLRGNVTRDLRISDLFFFTDEAQTNSISAQLYLANLANNADVQLTFRPLIKAGVAGIHVDAASGAVTVSAAPPPLVKSNFIMEVEAINASNGKKFNETIRVHVHASVTAVVLTPGTLTVRPVAPTRTNPEITSYRFAARVKFDDDTMGDITENHGITWGPPANVSSDGRLIVSPADAPGNTVTITATLPASLGGASASASMTIGTPWSATPHYTKGQCRRRRRLAERDPSRHKSQRPFHRRRLSASRSAGLREDFRTDCALPEDRSHGEAVRSVERVDQFLAGIRSDCNPRYFLPLRDLSSQSGRQAGRALCPESH